MAATARASRKPSRVPSPLPVTPSVVPSGTTVATSMAMVVRARVTAVEPDGGVQVTLDPGGAVGVRAVLAVTGGYGPRVGDTVLLAEDARGGRYVVGVLEAVRAGEAVQVRDPAGKLVFEHFPTENRSVVYAPAGDLEFRAEHGSIRLSAADVVAIQGERSVEVVGNRSVRLATSATEGLPASAVTLDARGMAIATPYLDARATRVEVAADEARLVARAVATAAETVRHVAGVVESQATRVVTRVKNAYHEVEELSQTRAGRMRLVAATTFHLLGGRTLLKAEQDMKLKGEKIHLG